MSAGGRAALLAAVLAASPVLAGSPGDSSLQSLRLPVGGRGAALGEAYTGLVTGAEALAWNPAALWRSERRNVTFSHASYVDSSFFDYAAYSQRLSTSSALGLGVKYFSAGSVTGRDAAGNESGDFTPYDAVFTAGYARERRGALYGGAVKYVRSRLRDSAGAAALDLGFLSRPLGGKGARLALTAHDLGGTVRYDSEKEKLPRTLRAGLGFELAPGWLGAVGAVLPADNGPFAAAGMEYAIPAGSGRTLAARAGLNTLTMSDVEGFTGLSLGLGFQTPGVHVDYGFAPLGELAMTHRLTLSYYFSPRPATAGPKPALRAPARPVVPPPRAAPPAPKPRPAPAAQPAPKPPSEAPDPAGRTEAPRPDALRAAPEPAEEGSIGFLPEGPSKPRRRGRER